MTTSSNWSPSSTALDTAGVVFTVSELAAQPGARLATRLLTRLRRYDIEVIAPGNRRPLRPRSAIAELQRFRAEVYREFDSLPDGHDGGATDEADDMAWHVVARLDGALVGCIRSVVFEHSLAVDVPGLMLRNSRCTFSACDRERCLAAIRAFLASRRPLFSPVIQFGGLAVAKSARRTVVPAALCLAGTALTRFIGSAGGVLFSAEKSRTESLYQKAGGFRLPFDGGVLEPLNDGFHRDRILVMGSAPFHNAPEVEAAIQVLSSHLFLERAHREASCA